MARTKHTPRTSKKTRIDSLGNSKEIYNATLQKPDSIEMLREYFSKHSVQEKIIFEKSKPIYFWYVMNYLDDRRILDIIYDYIVPMILEKNYSELQNWLSILESDEEKKFYHMIFQSGPEHRIKKGKESLWNPTIYEQSQLLVGLMIVELELVILRKT